MSAPLLAFLSIRCRCWRRWYFTGAGSVAVKIPHWAGGEGTLLVYPIWRDFSRQISIATLNRFYYLHLKSVPVPMSLKVLVLGPMSSLTLVLLQDKLVR
jgi:hypothetical protein